MGFKSARTGRDSKRKFNSCTLANVLPCSFGVLFVSLLMAILSLVIFAEGNTAAQQWEGVNVYHWLLLPLILVVLGVGGMMVELVLLQFLWLTANTSWWEVSYYADGALRQTLRWVLAFVAARVLWPAMVGIEDHKHSSLVLRAHTCFLLFIVLLGLKNVVFLWLTRDQNHHSFAATIRDLLFLECVIQRLRDPTAFSLDGTPPPLEMPEIPDDNVLFRDVMMKLKQKRSMKMNQGGATVKANMLHKELSGNKEKGSIAANAAAMARDIFTLTFRKESGDEWLVLEDFLKVLPERLPPRLRDDGEVDGEVEGEVLAEMIFERLVQGMGQRISRKRLAQTIVRFDADFVKLRSNLRNSDSVSTVLRTFATGIWLLASAVVVVAAFGSEVTAFMYPFFTLLISLSFIFGNTLRSILESCIFLFLVRPFDVGDEIIVNGDWGTVKSIQLLYTTLQDIYGKVKTLPNTSLTNSSITNLNRSAAAIFILSFGISFSTSSEKLWLLQSRLKRHCVASLEWKANPSFHVGSLDQCAEMGIKIWITSTHNWSDGRIWRNRTQFWSWLRVTLVDLGISYSMPPQPVGCSMDASMTALWAPESKDAGPQQRGQDKIDDAAEEAEFETRQKQDIMRRLIRRKRAASEKREEQSKSKQASREASVNRSRKVSNAHEVGIHMGEMTLQIPTGVSPGSKKVL